MKGESVSVGKFLPIVFQDRKALSTKGGSAMRFLRLKLFLALIFMVSLHFDWKPGMHWTIGIALLIGLVEFLLR